LLLASSLLIALLAMMPLLSIANGALAQHATYFVAAGLLLATALTSETEIAAAAKVLRRFSLAILFPLLWMMMQSIPLPFASIANPIWPTAAIALNDPSLQGHISIDPGSTLRSLIWCLTVLSVAVSTLIIAKDRRRAEAILIALSASATFVSLEILVGRSDAMAAIMPAIGRAGSGLTTVALLAVLSNGAIIEMAIERQLNQTNFDFSFSGPFLPKLFAGIFGIAISLAAIGTQENASLFMLVILGLAVMAFVAIFRRIGFRPWPSAILIAVLIGTVSAGSLQLLQRSPASGLLGVVPASEGAATAIAQRALSDSSWAGSGVGTFERLTKIYGDFGVGDFIGPPSTAVSVAIEWGRPAVLILAALAIQLFFFSFRGAIGRGRDSFFASATAASVLVVLCESFLDASLLTPAIQVILGITIGLGVSQATGRTSSL
jgi:hypothetical protein